MSNRPNNGENDLSLRDDLDRLGKAYGQLQREEPPELLDQAILNSAHRAVEKKPGWMQFGWLHGLTTAAVFVLALSLLFHQREQVPVYEDGVKLDDAMGLQREKAVKARSLDTMAGDLRMELKKESEKPADVLQETKVPTPRPDREIEADAGDQAPEPASTPRVNAYVSEGPQATTDSGDKDAKADEPAVEKLLVDDPGSAADTPEAAEISRQFRPAATAPAPVAEDEAPLEEVDDIEQQLLAIIKMKSAGDETWRAELDVFIQKYPGYPLPDELTN